MVREGLGYGSSLLPSTPDQLSWLGPEPIDAVRAPSRGHPQVVKKAGLTVFERCLNPEQ